MYSVFRFAVELRLLWGWYNMVSCGRFVGLGLVGFRVWLRSCSGEVLSLQIIS